MEIILNQHDSPKIPDSDLSHSSKNIHKLLKLNNPKGIDINKLS